MNIDFIAEEFFECCKLVAVPKPAIVNRRYVSNVELDIVSNKIASLVYSGLKIFLNEGEEQLFENFINVYYETQSVIQSGVYGSETYLAGALKMYNSPHDNIQSIQTEWLLMIVIHEYLNSKNDRYVVEKFIGHFNHNILEGIYDFYRCLYSKFKGRLKLSTSTLDYLKKGEDKVKDYSEEQIKLTEEEITKFINDILDGKDADSYVLAYSTPEQLKFESLGCPMNLKSQEEYDAWRKRIIWWATAYAHYGVWAYKLTEEGMKVIWPKGRQKKLRSGIFMAKENK